PRVVGFGVGGPVVARGHRSDAADVVDGDVVRHAQEPREEATLMLVIAIEHPHQLEKYGLCEVLCLMLVAHKMANVAVDVCRVPLVEVPKGITISGRRAFDRALCPSVVGVGAGGP